jgi:amino acid adenylation domain-containing protein
MNQPRNFNRQVKLSQPSLNQLVSQQKQQITETPEEKELAQKLLVLLNKEEQKNYVKICSLSFGQQRLWFLHQLELDNSNDRVCEALQLSGNLNIDALQQALNTIVNRHEILRANFISVDGNPMQFIRENPSLPLSIFDLSGIENEVGQEIELKRLLQQETQKPFNLRSDMMLRASLIKKSDRLHILLLTAHQIVCDRYSLEIFSRDLAASYTALVTNKSSPLEELSIQYTDFITWQQEQLQSEALETQLAYWKNQLKGKLSVLELPTDRRRPTIQSGRGARQPLVISQPLVEAIQALSRQEGCTLFMTLLAAFKVLLYRYSAREDILVGAPVASRDRFETESLIGNFVNTLVFRSDLSGEPSFRELLNRVRQVALEAYGNQDVPFAKLLEELQPDRNLSYNPLFQVMFSLQSASKSTLELPELNVEFLPIDRETTQFDLTLEIKEIAGELKGWFEYNTDIFETETVARMVGNFQILLEAIVANSEQPIDELSLLTAAEKHQVLMAWNDTKAEYTYDRTIHQLFEERVQQTPQQVALMFEDRQLTYQELNFRANQLGRYLQSLGVGAEVLVGIYMDRSLDVVVGLMAILKAGGAFLALDPSYPQERVAYMLDDAKVSILLTQEQLVETLPKHQAQIICLDRDRELIDRQNSENLDTLVTAENLAYAIYTSGSTGKPKGAMIVHANVCHYVQAMALRLGIVNSDRYLHTASFAFSSSVRQLMVPLCQGATILITNAEQRRNPLVMFELIKQRQVTVIDIIPSHWRNCINTLAQMEVEARNTLLNNQLRSIVSASEPLSSDIPRQWSFGFKHEARLINMFGQTETTGIVATYPIPREDDEQVKIVPIGKPLPNAQIYILGKNLNPSPIGVPGELYIGGANLARGYLNRPELTEEKFIANPFIGEEGARIYKTGDLARFLPDGNIDFLGRIDNQVKIRGFRIELGEIEAALVNRADVKEVVVIAREYQSGEKRLIAYIVPDGNSPNVSELRRSLKEILPEYMVPFAFVLLDKLPRTPNGKVNRNDLPAPDLTRQESAESFVAPRNETERQLAKIWEKILSVQPIGIRDSFFDVGGHSLLAVSLFTEIEQTFKQKLPLSTLFQAPTIEELANIIKGEASLVSWSSLVPIQTNGSKPPIFLIHARGTSILLYQNLAKYLDKNQPIYGLQPKGLDGQQKALSRVEDMAAHYLQEIKTVQPEGPYYLGGYSFGGDIAFEMAQQLLKQGEKIDLLVLFDCRGANSFQRLPLSERLSMHFKNLSEKKQDYLVERILDWQRWFKDNFKFIFQKFAFQSFQKLGLTLPLLLRNAFIEDLNVQAAKNYKPELYPGKLTLLRAKEWLGGVGCEVDEQLGWGNLAGEGVEIYDVPGNHFSIFDEPHVQKLAETLNVCLDRVQIDRPKIDR